MTDDGVDEFELFQARALGAESEMLLRQKARQLDRLVRGGRPPPAAGNRAADSDRNGAGGSTDGDPPSSAGGGGAAGASPRTGGGGGGSGPSPKSTADERPASIRRLEFRRFSSKLAMDESDYDVVVAAANAAAAAGNRTTPDGAAAAVHEDVIRSSHQRSYSWRAQPPTTALTTTMTTGQGQPEGGMHHLQCIGMEPSRLNRNRTMPARRRRPPSAVAGLTPRGGGGGSGTPEVASVARRNCSSTAVRTGSGSSYASSTLSSAGYAPPTNTRDDSPTDLAGGGECAIYRVRSFTTSRDHRRPGVVNTGDSVKICPGSVGGRVGSIRRTRPSSAATMAARSASPCPSLRGGGVRGAVGGGGTSAHRGVGREGSGSTRTSCAGDMPAVVAAEQYGGSHRGSTTGARLSVSGAGGGDEPGCYSRRSSGGSTGGGIMSSAKKVPAYRIQMVSPAAVDDEEKIFKILVIGSPGVGKTTLVYQLLTSDYLPNQDSFFQGRSKYLKQLKYSTSLLYFLVFKSDSSRIERL